MSTIRFISKPPIANTILYRCTSTQSLRSLSTSFYHSVPNTGSVARDHLANERTFLAWGRTGLGFLSLGTALFAAYETQNLPKSVDNLKRNGMSPSGATSNGRATAKTDLNKISSSNSDSESSTMNFTDIYSRLNSSEIIPACAMLWGNGALVLTFALKRYFSVQSALLKKNEFVLAKGSVVLITLSTALTCVGVVGWLVTVGIRREI